MSIGGTKKKANGKINSKSGSFIFSGILPPVQMLPFAFNYLRLLASLIIVVVCVSLPAAENSNTAKKCCSEKNN
jgi:hypothetical protein